MSETLAHAIWNNAMSPVIDPSANLSFIYQTSPNQDTVSLRVHFKYQIEIAKDPTAGY